MATETSPVDPASPQVDPAPATAAAAAPAPSTAPVDPAAPSQPDNVTAPDSDLQRQLTELQRKLEAVTKESIERRQKIGQLKTVEEQYADAHARNEELTRELNEARAKLEQYTSLESGERNTILTSMTEEDRELYGDLPLAKLRLIHQKHYATKPAADSQGDGKPPAADAELPLEAQMEAALAAGDTKKFNELYDRARGR